MRLQSSVVPTFLCWVVLEMTALAQGPDADGDYRMMGRVQVAETGEPVQGATVKVAVGGHSSDSLDYEFRTAASDGDGNFVVNLPLGTARAWFLQPPPGYWTSSSIARRAFNVSPAMRMHRQDYTVRRGRVWTVGLTRGEDKVPVRAGFVLHNLVAGEAPSYFHTGVDEAGWAKVTLPEAAGRATMVMQAGDVPGSKEHVSLEWEAGFLPDAIKNVDKSDQGGPNARFRLIDVTGRTATASGPVEPLVTNGRLVLRVLFPGPDAKAFGALTGRIVDEGGRPVAGAAVGLVIWEANTTEHDNHREYTDDQGRYLFHRLARRGAEGELRFGVVARKPGYSGGTSQPAFVQLAAGDTPQVIEPIRLTPGVVINGSVIDNEGRAIEGAWVKIQDFNVGQLVKTDSEGHFTFRDVTRGLVAVVVQAGELSRQERLVADGGPDLVTIQLPRSEAVDTKNSPSPSMLVPVKRGQPAPPWQVSGWTDEKSRVLADYRGKVVLLDFWGIWYGPCVRALPSLETLKRKYEAKGVVFLGVHTPGEDVVQVRKFLDLKGISFPSGIDAGDLNTHGATAQQYGVTGLPTIILIDREGVVACSSHDPSFLEKFTAIMAEQRLEAESITPDRWKQINEILLDREIEKLVAQRPNSK
jgi:thiol-disulfide isomerase/thioredoxin/uncharacterized GH25 family protein